MKQRILFLILFSWSLASPGTALASIDTTSFFHIRSIALKGNKITRPGIILRELTVQQGDTIPCTALPGHLLKSRENLFNTSLFNVVAIDTSGIPDNPGDLDILVTVIERWYIWPIPYLEFPNHNFNAWMKDPLFSHLTYGINLTFYNARGWNETLTLLLHLGYNQKYGFTYKVPYLNRRKTWGFGFGAEAGLNRTLQVSVEKNHNVYMATGNGFLQQHYMAFAEVYHRPAWYVYHTLNVSFNQYVFADTLRMYEGFFAQDTSLRQHFFSLWYKIKIDRRDVRFYPLKGYYADLTLTKHGFSSTPADLFVFQTTLKGFWKLSRRWYFASGVTAKASFPDEQPFFLAEGLGFGRDYVRGYDSYIIPGQHFLISKNNVKFALLPERQANLKFIGSPKFSVIPLALYLNLFTDFGYVWNHNQMQRSANSLTNTLLFGYGLGLDFTTYYDLVIGVNFSLNLQGVPDASIHFIAPI